MTNGTLDFLCNILHGLRIGDIAFEEGDFWVVLQVGWELIDVKSYNANALGREILCKESAEATRGSSHNADLLFPFPVRLVGRKVEVVTRPLCEVAVDVPHKSDSKEPFQSSDETTYVVRREYLPQLLQEWLPDGRGSSGEQIKSRTSEKW